VISPDSGLEVQWVDLGQIRFDNQEISQKQVDYYTGMLRGHDWHLSPPVLNADYTVRDGRHRLLAHIAAGRTAARCIIVTTKESNPS
jgi:hypothetical protein